MTIRLALALTAGLLLLPASQTPTIMKLKDGRVMRLKEPPKVAGGRVVFTTAEGNTYSLPEGDVLSIRAESAPTPAPTKLNALDSHSLGAIARQERQKTGKNSELGVRATPSPKPSKTPRPAGTPGP
ncbi:MAG: hypothetical protein ACRD00_02455 [Thermoanaerobaculia bacterium]